MKVAIVHYWWLSNRGGEAVVAEIASLYPTADIYLHVCDERLIRETLGSGFTGKIQTTFISKLPLASNLYQFYLPLMPLALEQLDLSAYDLVISSEAGPAKGVITRPDALHICYCHSPMRYVWDQYHEYLRNAGRFKRLVFPYIAHRLRLWDQASAARVDHFIANSAFVAARIRKFYKREAVVVNPPVRTQEFDPTRPRSNRYLYLGQLVPYKRVDIAIAVFNELGLPLDVIGEGPDREMLQSRAKANIRFLGRVPFAEVKAALEGCRALIFPGVEDFGIVPVEAMSAGAPVIAFKRGGIVETVIDGKTGILYENSGIDGLRSGVNSFETDPQRFDAKVISEHTSAFCASRFREQMQQVIERLISGASQIEAQDDHDII